MAANPSSPSAGGDMSSSPTPPPVRLAAAQAAGAIQPSSPRYFFSSLAGTNASLHRRIAIAVDLSDESAFAVQWAVQNYLRPGDAVVLLHVRPTSVLYGADWGSIPVSVSDDAAGADGEDIPAASAEELQKKQEEDFDAFTSTKAQDLAQPLVDAQIPFKIHVVKDHDMKERLCLEAERLGLSAMIMGSRGFGASRKGGKGRLGSVSDYCVRHCVCPVVVVRYPDDAAGAGGAAVGATDELHTVPKDEPEVDKVGLRAYDAGGFDSSVLDHCRKLRQRNATGDQGKHGACTEVIHVYLNDATGCLSVTSVSTAYHKLGWPECCFPFSS